MMHFLFGPFCQDQLVPQVGRRERSVMEKYVSRLRYKIDIARLHYNLDEIRFEGSLSGEGVALPPHRGGLLVYDGASFYFVTCSAR